MQLKQAQVCLVSSSKLARYWRYFLKRLSVREKLLPNQVFLIPVMLLFLTRIASQPNFRLDGPTLRTHFMAALYALRSMSIALYCKRVHAALIFDMYTDTLIYRHSNQHLPVSCIYPNSIPQSPAESRRIMYRSREKLCSVN